MNCDSCGAPPEAPHHSCNCTISDCASSPPATLSARPPFANRRWFLRRLSPRKPDPNTSNSSCAASDDFRKPDDTHVSPLNIQSPDQPAPQSPSDQILARPRLDAPPALLQQPPPEQPPAEIDDADPDLDDPDLDAGSMEVSAAQSETASTISRATFSIGDKPDVDLNTTVLTSANPAEERRKPTPAPSPPQLRAQLRAAYVRELLLSSLSL